jgi:anti-sigma B factor antagonist
MTFEISTGEDGLMKLAIRGELDAVSVSELRPELDGLVSKRPRRVEVDLSRLRMVDSSGVGALVSLYKRVRAQGGSVVVVGLQDQPLAIFRLLRLDRVMTGGDLPPTALPRPEGSPQN